MVTTLAKTNTTELLFGNSDELNQFAARIKMMMKGGDKLSAPEALTLAQFALVTGLNPFVGECWYIPGSGPMVGIAGARRLDQEATAARGGYSTVDVIPCPPEEAGAMEHEIKDVIAAFKAEITDSAAALEYQKMFAAMLKDLRESGVADPVPVAREICGPRPKWTGYGYSTKNEKSRMNKTQLARKRSESDALKKKIIIPFGAEVGESDVAPDYIEATAIDPEPKHTKAENIAALGFTPAQPEESLDEALKSKTLPRQMPYEDAKQVLVKTSKGDKFVGEMTIEELNKVIEKSIIPASVEAARIVLAHDFQIEPETIESNTPQGQLL